MRRIASLRGKIYELIELPPAEVAAIVAINGYDSIPRFIDRHANWQSSMTDDLKIHDSTPVRPPKHRTRPVIEKVMAQKRGRPRKVISTTKVPSTSKKKRKRRSKYGFERIKRQHDFIFVEGEAYKVAAAAAYFGSRYTPIRKYSVHKSTMDGITGSRVEWVG